MIIVLTPLCEIFNAFLLSSVITFFIMLHYYELVSPLLWLQFWTVSRISLWIKIWVLVRVSFHNKLFGKVWPTSVRFPTRNPEEPLKPKHDAVCCWWGFECIMCGGGWRFLRSSPFSHPCTVARTWRWRYCCIMETVVNM